MPVFSHSLGRLQSILYHAEIGSSGWTADIRTRFLLRAMCLFRRRRHPRGAKRAGVRPVRVHGLLGPHTRTLLVQLQNLSKTGAELLNRVFHFVSKRIIAIS